MSVLAPPLLDLLQDTVAGGRLAMGLPVVLLAALYLRYRHQPLPAAPAGRRTGRRARLPLSCWLLAALVAVGIAVEFCPVYFGAELLTAAGSGDTANARAQLLGGVLVIVAPYLLGSLADHLGLHAAFIIAILIGACAVLLLAGRRRQALP